MVGKGQGAGSWSTGSLTKNRGVPIISAFLGHPQRHKLQTLDVRSLRYHLDIPPKKRKNHCMGSNLRMFILLLVTDFFNGTGIFSSYIYTYYVDSI